MGTAVTYRSGVTLSRSTICQCLNYVGTSLHISDTLACLTVGGRRISHLAPSRAFSALFTLATENASSM